jgi:hypothetical protein
MNREGLEELFRRMQNYFENNSQVNFSLEYVSSHDNGVIIPHFLKETGLFAFKENWENKVEALSSIVQRSGHTKTSKLDIHALFSPKNEGSPRDFFKIATIFGTLPNGKTQIEFIHEVENSIVVKSFTLSTYYFDFSQGKKRCLEVGSSWENGINLHGLSVKDFMRNPDQFIKERGV